MQFLKIGFVQIRGLVSRKKFTVTFSFFSFIGLLITTMIIRDIFSTQSSKTYISFYPQGLRYQPANITVIVIYKPNGPDTLEINSWFKAEEIDISDEALKMYTSDNLIPVEAEKNSYGSMKLTEAILSKHEYWYDFVQPMRDENMYYLNQHFEGDIFGKSESDLRLNFSFYADSDSDVQKLTIMIGGLSDISITDVYPAPTEINPYTIVYEYDSISDQELKSLGINIVGVNRRVERNVEFKLVILGILTGVFSSVIADIGLDLIRSKEKNIQ